MYNTFSDITKVRSTQTSKMVYVGCSRPTHLLAIAIHKDRFNNLSFPVNTWKIKDITID